MHMDDEEEWELAEQEKEAAKAKWLATAEGGGIVEEEESQSAFPIEESSFPIENSNYFLLSIEEC